MDTTETGHAQDVLSLEEAASFLYVSKSTVYRLLNQGKLRGMKAGKQWRFRKQDLVEYLLRGPAALALANLPIEVLDTELAFFAEELTRTGASPEGSDDPSLVGEAGKVTQLLRRMVWLLHIRGGSDLHLEPYWEAGQTHLRLQLRLDGVLQEIRRFPLALQEPLVLAWKELAGLAVEERARPQSGSAHLTFGETRVVLRVSLVPTLYGERLAVRDVPTTVPTLSLLGLEDTPLRPWALAPHGLVLISGPTGSGKSTVAAACLQELCGRNLNIFMVEDPVQYLFLPQDVTTLRADGFSRAEAVQAVLWQDPDVLAVGDVGDDPELARRTVQAAATGHLVLATMHAHDSLAPLYELVDYGIKPSQLALTLLGSANQRLLAHLCPACKQPYRPDPELLAHLTAAAAAGGYQLPKGAQFSQPGSAPECPTCHGRGIVGRFAMHEFFTFTPPLKAAFLRGAPPEELTARARELGMQSSFAVALQHAVAGRTSLEEVLRKVPNWRS